MTQKRINPNAFKDPVVRQAMQVAKWNYDDIAAQMMRKDVYDTDEDGLIELASGGTEADLSGVTKGSVIVCNANGVLSSTQSSTEGDAPRIQADGTVAWEAVAATSAPMNIGFAVTGTLSTGDKAPWSPPMKSAGTIVGATAIAKTVSSSGAVSIDILKSTNDGADWTTIFTTGITLDEGERSTETAATPSALSVTTYAVGDLFRINIDDVGTDTADLTVGLFCAEAVS